MCPKGYYGDGFPGSVGNCGSGNRRVKSVYAKVDKGDKWLVVTNGIPNHCHDTAADRQNPNIACENYRGYYVPKTTRLTSFGYVRMGAAGVATSGAFIYNDKSAEISCNAAAVTEKSTFDPCDGHSRPNNKQYHYHKLPYPTCIPGGYSECKLMGYMIDGLPIYTPCTFNNTGSTKSCYKLKNELLADTSSKYGFDSGDYEFRDGQNACNLNDANGMYFSQNTYSTNGVLFPANSMAYFYSFKYPYLPPKYYGWGSTVICKP